MRRWTAALLALLLFVCAAAAGAEEAAETTGTTSTSAASPAPTARPYGEPVSGNLRVWLQSLGQRDVLGISLTGTYSVDGDRGFQFAPESDIAIALDNGHLVLSVGGATIDMGGDFTLKRHLNDDGSAGGAYIHEGERDTLYNGDLSFAARNDSIRVIVTLGIEEYLYGVVPYEMSDQFPLEALKAQSVAARTFALQKRARKSNEEYDVVDTTSDQVFKGYEAQYAVAIQAINETRGVVGMYDGAYAECLYSASNGGQTALPSDVWGGVLAYYKMQDDPYDLANGESIERTALVTREATDLPEELALALSEAVAEKLNAVGTAFTIDEVVKAEAVSPIYGGESRQYGTIRFTVKVSRGGAVAPPSDELFQMATDEDETEAVPVTDPVTVDLSFYDVVRQALGIGINASQYDLVTVEETTEGFLFTNRRYGHGVGMSQRGAEQMALADGKTYLDILNYYYPGMELVQMTWTETALTQADSLPESLGYAAPRPTAAPTPAPLPALTGTQYYGVVTVEGHDSTVRVRSGPSTDGDIVGQLRGGTRVIVDGEEGEWVKLHTVEIEGYMMKSFITKE